MANERRFYCDDFDYACNDRKEVGKYPISMFIENHSKFFDFMSYAEMASMFLPYGKGTYTGNGQNTIFKDGEFPAFIDQLVQHVTFNNIPITCHNELYVITKEVFQKFKDEMNKQKKAVLFSGMLRPKH
ncbi:MAG: hypothetical protein ACRDAQ_06305 [Cetobacterium sp.]